MNKDKTIIVDGKTLPESSADVALTFLLLSEMEPGDIVTYEAVQEIIGADPQESKGRSILSRARDKALVDKRIVTESIINVGIKRLTDSEIAQTIGQATTDKIRRTAKKGIIKCTAIRNFNGLTKDEQYAHNAAISMLGAISQSATGSNLKKLTIEVEHKTDKLSIGATLELFNKDE